MSLRRDVVVAGQLVGPVARQLPWWQLAVACAVGALPVLVTVVVAGWTLVGTVVTLRIVLALVAVGAASWLTSLRDEVSTATPVSSALPRLVAVALLVPVVAAVVVGLVGPLLGHLASTGRMAGPTITMARQAGVAVQVDLAWELVALILLGWVLAGGAERGGLERGEVIAAPVVLAVSAVGTRWPTGLPLLPELRPDPTTMDSGMAMEVVWRTWVVAHHRIVIATVVLAVVVGVLVVNEHGFAQLRRAVGAQPSPTPVPQRVGPTVHDTIEDAS